MPFLVHDHYLTSGTSQLINSWTDPVYKFDSSSFYNWEQDNLPIYDLEERDMLLYEMAGYPLSSVIGMSLCVSDCGIDNKRVFGSLSGAIDALPNTIRFPIIIEVAASGELGELVLQDKVFEGSGAGLEIINRGFAKGLCSSAAGNSTTYASVTAGSPLSAVTQVFSRDLTETMYQSSALCVSNTVYQRSTAGAYWDNFVRAFFLTPEWSIDGAASPRTPSISSYFQDSYAGVANFSSAPHTFEVGTTYNGGGYIDNSLSSDMYIVNPTIGPAGPGASQTYRVGVPQGSSTRATGFVYANALSRVFIKDCTGKIYLRGFCVDGANMADMTDSDSLQLTSKGIDIENSEVVIENCTVTRCADAGLEAVNSNVTLNRGFIAFRNYELANLGSGNHLNSKVITNPTPGLRAVNSNITLSSTGASSTGLPIDSPFCFYRNTLGIDLQNSRLETPEAFKFGTNVYGETASENYGSQTLVLQSFFNNLDGIRACESIIKTSQRIASFANGVGANLINSALQVGNFTFDHNQLTGLLGSNSKINYNKDGIINTNTAGPFYPQYNFQDNGQDIVLDNCELVPTYVSGMPAYYNTFQLSGNHQCGGRFIPGSADPLADTRRSTLPSVVLKNGSYMDGIAVKSINPTFLSDSTAYSAREGIKGSAFQVTDQSTLRLVGVKDHATYILGPANSDKQQKIAGLYAGNSSKINICGPTVIAQVGINALAEDGSTIEIGPPQKDGIIDVSGFDLGKTANHTKVQLHSTRACLVANRNSVLNMHDLGDYHNFWSGTYYTNQALDYRTGDSHYTTSAYTKGGLLQFYPNPFVPYGTDIAGKLELQKQAEYPATPLAAFPNAYTDITSQDVTVSNASWGGMCVRAVGGSQVEVKNVMFPAGWAGPSGAYYDASTLGGCDLLRIWNIADNSELRASYLSVSDAHPQDTSAYYTGPSAVWVSGSSPSYVPLSGAPRNTPDTSTLSVLDSFGLGYNHGGPEEGIGFYGKPQYENIGPFRIYISPHPKAKYLGYVRQPDGNFFTPWAAPAGVTRGSKIFSMGYGMTAATLFSGAPYQLFAQGYATSSDCSAANSQGPTWENPSSIYQELGFSSFIEELRQSTPWVVSAADEASSFFYVSAMTPKDSQNRIWLDESAMNTFANAKNGTLGTSGRQKLFSYYKTTTQGPGEGSWDADTGFGTGFRSANLFDIDREL